MYDRVNFVSVKQIVVCVSQKEVNLAIWYIHEFFPKSSQ
jgi:hypothetical protein